MTWGSYEGGRRREYQLETQKSSVYFMPRGYIYAPLKVSAMELLPALVHRNASDVDESAPRGDVAPNWRAVPEAFQPAVGRPSA